MSPQTAFGSQFNRIFEKATIIHRFKNWKVAGPAKCFPEIRRE
jgi:hypothetical protein